MIGDLIRMYGNWGLVLILGLDSSGVPWPTEATLVVAGAAAGKGHLNIYLALAASLVGALLGSSLSYYLGQRMGPALMRRIATAFHLTDRQIGKVDEWFERHGHRAVFFGRLVPFVRNFTGYPAGVLGVPFPKYLVFSLAGYALYISIALGLGYGGVTFAAWLERFEMAFWVLIPLGLLLAWFKWGRKWAANRWGKG